MRDAGRTKRLVLAVGIVAALTATAATAAACAMCGARAKEGGAGYVVGTLVLLVLPFVGLGGLVLWLRYQKR